MFRENCATILEEIQGVLVQVDPAQVDTLLAEITGASRIVTAGAGRVGLAARGFAMRLGHLGFSAFALGDMTVPGLGKGDLLLVASGSGETPTIAHVAEVAKKSGARVAAVTGSPDSRIGRLANVVVRIPAPSKTKMVERFTSVQPMTTLNEQCLTVFFDVVVLQLMERMHETHDSMWARHSNLE